MPNATASIDIALKIYDQVKNLLVIGGLSEETAKKYATFATELYDYIKSSPALQTALAGAKSTFEMAQGGKQYLMMSKEAERALGMDLLGSAKKIGARGKFSAGGLISAFVDYFVTVAKQLGIEMNACAIAVTKVILDVLSGIALFSSGLGAWAGALQLMSTVADAVELKEACFSEM